MLAKTADVVSIDFESMDEWRAWAAANSYRMRDEALAEVRSHGQANGVIEPLTGRTFTAEQIEWNPENMRESGAAAGLISRHRATLLAIAECLPDINKYETKIYGAEALTEFALALRSIYPKFIGSEYAINEHVTRWLYPIPSEDLTALSFGDETFDLVTTNEVLEHVPSIDAALAEIKRVLKPGGWHVGTCPFVYGQQESIVKARLDANGAIIEMMKPEYHGNPMSEKGSLVFELPGWDILSRAKAAGFSRAFWKYLRSASYGIAANDTGGVFVLCLRR
ncbi:class I SAM-dependent methyltransferase [Bosea sp. UNC402CLCol]|uniref:class I SAM-dependent methyltransferase n=1 Tax=Bosea sp. UNC402CLCol TaxID=1510531 RepID=UPI000AD51A84|nr:class I SAM-dependent methyltransferase [Bosea sp. UNC402CLCol]